MYAFLRSCNKFNLINYREGRKNGNWEKKINWKLNLCVMCNSIVLIWTVGLTSAFGFHQFLKLFSSVFLLNISYTWKWFRTVHDCRVPSEYVRKSVNKKSRKYERCAQTRDVGVCAYSVASYSRFHICECQIQSLSGTIADESETKEKEDQPTRRINAKRNNVIYKQCKFSSVARKYSHSLQTVNDNLLI